MAINKIPPLSAQNNAKRGLELRKKYNRGGLSASEASEQDIRSGVNSARSISSGNGLSTDLIKAMARFNRFRKDYQPDKRESDGGQTAGTIAWLLWGGTTGVDWALKKSKEIDNEKQQEGNSTKKSNNMNKEYKSFSFEIKNYRNEEEYFYFEGYASTFGNVDRGNDIIEKGAFTDTLKKDKFKILWQHKMIEPIGMPIKAYEDEKGLYIEAKLPKDDDFVRGRVIPQMKCGTIDSMSIGFIVKEDDYVDYGQDERERYKEKVRVIKSVDLFEVSLVSMPMNPLAMVSSFKSEDLAKYLPEDNKDEAAAIVEDCFSKMVNDLPKSKEQKENIQTKSVQEVTCMKDIENILKLKCNFSQNERKVFISKIKDFSKQRDVVNEVKELRDVIRGQEMTKTLNNFINDLKNI